MHFTRDMLMHCRRDQRGLVGAALREIFNAESYEQARQRSGQVIERLQEPCPKVAELLTGAEEDLLAFYRFPQAHWSKLRSTNPLERVVRHEAPCERCHEQSVPPDGYEQSIRSPV